MKSVRKILIKNDLDELSDSAAELLERFVNEAVAKRGFASVSLAGGSTPRSLYTLLASNRYQTSIAWEKVRFFFGDERNVPIDSPESNFRMASETLLSPLEITAENVFRWRTEFGDVEHTATDYQNALTKNGPFDLMLLGLGADAHTASLFPQTPALLETQRLAVANWVPKLGDHRFTVTFPAINNASNVMFLVSGEEKAAAVANVLEGDNRPDDLPAQGVRPHNGNLYWLLDEGAASLLKAE